MLLLLQVWGQVRTLMEKNASLEASKRSLEEDIERVSIMYWSNNSSVKIQPFHMLERNDTCTIVFISFIHSQYCKILTCPAHKWVCLKCTEMLQILHFPLILHPQQLIKIVGQVDCFRYPHKESPEMQTLSVKQLCHEFRHSYNFKMVIYMVSFQWKQIVDIYKVPSDLFWFWLKVCPS